MSDKIKNYYQQLTEYVKNLKPLPNPNNEPINSNDGRFLGVLDDKLAKQFWTEKQKWRRNMILAELDGRPFEGAKYHLRYKICQALFWNRVAEIFDYFGKGSLSIRSNWEIVAFDESRPRSLFMDYLI